MERHMMLCHGGYAIMQKPVVSSPILEDGERTFGQRTSPTYFQAISKMAFSNLFSETSGIKSIIVPESFI